MKDSQFAVLTALAVVGLWLLWFWLACGLIIRAHLRYFMSGPLVFQRGGMSTAAGFGLLVSGVFLVVFVPALAFWRAVKLRRAGRVLQRAHSEVQRGMPGMEDLRERVHADRIRPTA